VCQHWSDAAGGDDGWDTDKSAGAQDDIRAECGQGSSRGQHAEGNSRGIGQISERQIAAELPSWYSDEADAGVFCSPSLHALPTANPDQVCEGTALPQLIDGGQGWQHMATCATTCNCQAQPLTIAEHSRDSLHHDPDGV
jgi:hypothetical protein